MNVLQQDNDYITRKEAENYINQYFATYPGIKNYLDGLVAEAKETGSVSTLYGRKRPVPEISSSNFMQRSFGERIAMNSPIQGTAADIMKIAMIRVFERMERENLKSRMILQVHDELNFNIVPEEKDAMQRLVVEEMQNAFRMSVPLIADYGWGNNWLEAH
mgnify:CR=1 FL=1